MQQPFAGWREGIEVGTGQIKSRSTEIHGMSVPSRQSSGQSNRHRAAACSQISPATCDGKSAQWLRLKTIECKINQQLGLLAGDQCRWADAELKITPGAASDEMLQGNMTLKML